MLGEIHHVEKDRSCSKEMKFQIEKIKWEREGNIILI